MTLPPRPDPSRRPASKPATARAGTARVPTGRAPAAPAPKSKTPIILACAGGGVLLLIILFVAMSGDDSKAKTGTASKTKAPKEEAPKRIAPDVSGLEATGAAKCKAGLDKVLPRLNPDSSVPKERVRADLEEGLKLLKAGLEAYEKATAQAGKKYATGEFERARKVAIGLFCTDLEKEGQASCDEGLKVIRSTEVQVSDTGKLSEAEKSKLLEDLRKGTKLIQDGFGLLDRSFEVSGRRFETTQYQEALKVARPKILELKSN